MSHVTKKKNLPKLILGLLESFETHLFFFENLDVTMVTCHHVTWHVTVVTCHQLFINSLHNSLTSWRLFGTVVRRGAEKMGENVSPDCFQWDVYIWYWTNNSWIQKFGQAKEVSLCSCHKVTFKQFPIKTLRFETLWLWVSSCILCVLRPGHCWLSLGFTNTNKHNPMFT